MAEEGSSLKRLAGGANLAVMAGLFALNVALNLPLFAPGEAPYRDSIEGGYASMARFFSENPNPWGWNPTQYAGLPAQFTYLPSLPYVAGMISRFAPLAPDYAYRLLASTFACLGPATLFLFVLYFTRSRWWALSTALAYTFFSPLYNFVPAIAADQGMAYLPWRLQVLVKYGEGPHNAGLALLPLALIGVWRAALTRGFTTIFAAALLLAAVALTNWIAALALACCCLLVLTTLAGSHEITGFRARRVFAAAALAYGLACFWLTPSFVQTIAFNWPADAFNYHLLGVQKLLIAALFFVLLLLRLVLGRIFPRDYYLHFVTLSSVAFGWVVLWFYFRGLNTIPESRRYALEMELFLFAVFFEWMRVAMRARIVPVTLFASCAVAAVVCLGAGQLRAYCTQGIANRRPLSKETTIEYRMAERLAELRPQGRVFASGGLRFRLNSWFPIHQAGGGFESGLQNRMPLTLIYRIRVGGEDAVRTLKTLGVEYLAVHGPKSREHYRDFTNPQMFEGLLEPVWREEDDTIYRVPFSSLAHTVGRNAALAVSWPGASDIHLDGAVADTQPVSLQVNYDPDWRATQNGERIEIERDQHGYMVLHPMASPTAHIELAYRGSWEQRIMAALSALVWIGSILAVISEVRRRPKDYRQ